MTNFKFQQPVHASYWYQNQYGHDVFDLVDSCEFAGFFFSRDGRDYLVYDPAEKCIRRCFSCKGV